MLRYIMQLLHTSKFETFRCQSGALVEVETCHIAGHEPVIFINLPDQGSLRIDDVPDSILSTVERLWLTNRK